LTFAVFVVCVVLFTVKYHSNFLLFVNFLHSRFIGQSTDMFDGGIPPTPQALAISHILSMPPMVFTSAPSFAYIESESLTNFIDPITKQAVFPPASSWSTVGMVVGFYKVLPFISVNNQGIMCRG
jgi:hypothetical protein